MGFEPIRPSALNLERHGQLDGLFHVGLTSAAADLVGGHVKDQFVVHLRNHPPPITFKASWMRTMAILMMSAADPWMGR